MPRKEVWDKDYGLSIVAPRNHRPLTEPSSWSFQYPGEQETTIVPGGRWWTHASLRDVDGIGAYVTVRPLSALVCQIKGHSPLFLHPPMPVPFFALSRYQLPIVLPEEIDGSGVYPPVTTWLYTCVGYLLPEIRVFLTILPDHSEMHVEARTEPLSFV